MKANPQIKLYKYDNSAFILIAIIDDYQQISFEHSLYSAGTFTITINYNIPNARLFERGLFVQFGDNPHDFGEILTMRNSIGPDGKGSEILNITGYDARYLFKRRIIRNLNSNDVWAMTAKGEICLRSLVRSECGDGAESKRRLPISNVIPETASAKGGVYSVSESYTNLYDALCTIATQSEIGWAVAFENGALTLEVFEGRDLKDSVFFSTDFESLANGEYTDTAESFANVLYIGGKGEGSEQDMYEGAVTDEGGNEPTVLDRFEAYDSQSSMTTEEEYEAEAGAMLSQYSQNVTVSGAGLVKCPFVFRESYDVGDVITLRFSDKTAVTQILSVTEQWSNGSYTLSFSFGKPQNNLAQQISLLLKKISNASKKTKAIECVKWYTIPTDTAQSEADVTFDTLGFTGAMTADATFTLYADDEGTGSKIYNVYVKNLSGSHTLTLTTGKAGATSYALQPGTYNAQIYVDENGSIIQRSISAINSVTANSSQAVTSGAVASALGGIEQEIDALQPVDSVTGGNMHSVTSNAVNEAIVSNTPKNVVNIDTDIPEGSGNLSTTATAHKITTYRNGFTIPYQMDNTDDGGMLRVRGTSEDNCILELSTWDDSGSGETIQFNYYPTTSKDTPTHSVSVPKKSGIIALISDILTKTSQLTNDSGFITASATVANASKLGNWDYLLSAATSGSNKWIGVSAWSWSDNSGYIKFTNGLMIQFFQTSYTYSRTISFPMSFDNYCVSLSMLILDSYYSAGVGININNVRNLTKSSFWAQLDGNTPKECWIAIGY